MRYSEENKMVKCSACGSENGIIKVLDYILCPSCNKHVNNAKELINGKGKNNIA